MGWGQDRLHRRGKFWHLGYRDENGKRVEKSTGKTDYKEAVKYRTDYLERLRQGQLPTEMADWTLQTAVDRYNEWRGATAASNTACTERTLLRAVVNFFGPEKRLRTFKPQDFRDYQVHRLKSISPTMKRPVQPRSINYELMCLRTILIRANLWHGTLATEYKRLQQPKPTCGRALTPEEGKRLVRQCEIAPIRSQVLLLGTRHPQQVLLNANEVDFGGWIRSRIVRDSLCLPHVEVHANGDNDNQCDEAEST